VEKATAEAEKHADRSEQLAALVAEAREMLEQARVVKAERARVAAEEAEAANGLVARKLPKLKPTPIYLSPHPATPTFTTTPPQT
jgi:hypothetical protein